MDTSWMLNIRAKAERWELDRGWVQSMDIKADEQGVLAGHGQQGRLAGTGCRAFVKKLVITWLFPRHRDNFQK